MDGDPGRPDFAAWNGIRPQIWALTKLSPAVLRFHSGKRGVKFLSLRSRSEAPDWPQSSHRLTGCTNSLHTRWAWPTVKSLSVSWGSARSRKASFTSQAHRRCRCFTEEDQGTPLPLFRLSAARFIAVFSPVTERASSSKFLEDASGRPEQRRVSLTPILEPSQTSLLKIALRQGPDLATRPSILPPSRGRAKQLGNRGNVTLDNGAKSNES
ncbi:hypothetical protein SKAU_G00065740 [Synaphobranchus kaupii]|uniref:Uncharacterized protein n=1 Tax=Synaphobranchus kaupii TaxID=118154 RepID=A0A9Q1G5R4_SYNKA|nr:hypothetical protein SKAU_G00065740 [Synaphobranchus kaupii]